MKKKNDWKNRDGIVYSTRSDFEYKRTTENDGNTVHSSAQALTISLDRSGRAGKQVTLVTGFGGSSDELEKLGKTLKSGCGVGGSVKEGVILIQGDVREKARKILQSHGYKTKMKG
jgi:translation initiation factor 1